MGTSRGGEQVFLLLLAQKLNPFNAIKPFEKLEKIKPIQHIRQDFLCEKPLKKKCKAKKTQNQRPQI